MWEPMQIRHRSAYYDAFFTESLLSFVETGLASAYQAKASRAAISDMVEFCLTTSREEVRAHDGSRRSQADGAASQDRALPGSGLQRSIRRHPRGAPGERDTRAAVAVVVDE